MLRSRGANTRPAAERQTWRCRLAGGRRAVLEGVPAARTRNHFFTPAGQAGLDEDDRAFRTRVGAAVSGIGCMRGMPHRLQLRGKRPLVDRLDDAEPRDQRLGSGAFSRRARARGQTPLRPPSARDALSARAARRRRDRALDRRRGRSRVRARRLAGPRSPTTARPINAGVAARSGRLALLPGADAVASLLARAPPPS